MNFAYLAVLRNLFKKHPISLCVGILVIFAFGSTYFISSSSNRKEELSVNTIDKQLVESPNTIPSPTATISFKGAQSEVVTEISTKIPTPTPTYVPVIIDTPTPTNIPTPSVTPTPGPMGFNIDQMIDKEFDPLVSTDIPKGQCSVVFTVTPRGSTAFHLSDYAPFVGDEKATTDIYWKQSSFVIHNQEPVNVELCVSPDTHYCGYVYASDKTILYDDTTGAKMMFRVHNKINC